VVVAGTAGSSVGYHVRLDAASTRDTKLLFCTTGILLRRLSSDPSLPSVSHIVVDEVISAASPICYISSLHA
jgi:HrpA-like RNA helicase